MRIVCDWCNKVMQDGSKPTSHGICEQCAKKLCPGDEVMPDLGSPLGRVEDGAVFCFLCGWERKAKSYEYAEALFVKHAKERHGLRVLYHVPDDTGEAEKVPQ